MELVFCIHLVGDNARENMILHVVDRKGNTLTCNVLRGQMGYRTGNGEKLNNS